MDDAGAALGEHAPEDAAPRPHRSGHALFRLLFVPALLGVSVISWWYHAETERYLAGARWGIDHTTAALLVSILLIWIAEQVYPSHADWNYNVASNPVRGLNRFGRDLFYLTFITLLNGLAIGFLFTRVTSLMARVGFGFDRVGAWWPSGAPFAAKVLLVFFIVELGSYWFHRLAHRFDFLWRFHSTHHVITEITGLKALRTHPIDNAFFYIPRTVPLMFMGAGAAEMLAATYFGCILGILSHANISVSETGLGWLVNFPRYHEAHHASELADSNSNFGCHTVLWDRIFGTFRERKGNSAIGVMPVGPRTLWNELVRPFYRRAS